MKIVFLFENSAYLEVEPQQLQIRQIQPDLAAVVTPTGTTNEAGEETFHILITFPVILSAVPKPLPIPAGVATAVPDAPAPTDISTAKKKTAKRK